MPPKRISNKIPKRIAANLLKTPASTTESGNTITLSKYAAALTAEHLERYLQKISVVGTDPYLLAMSTTEIPENVSFESIIDYALHTKSAYTGASLNCFKAVEAKQRFECGMVKLVEGARLGQIHVVRGKVRMDDRREYIN